MNEELGRHLIHRWNVGDALRRSAARFPDKTALRHLDRSLTYREADALANRVANVLEAKGIGKGDPVAFLGLNSDVFAAAFFGTARIGAPFVPVNALLKGGEIDYVLDKAGAKALVVDPMLAGLLDAKSPVVRAIGVKLALGTEPVGDFEPLAPLLEEAGDAAVERVVGNDDPMAYLFTSGTSAFPKAVVNTHLNFYATVLSALADLGISREHENLLALPLFHVAGIYLLFASIATGATVTLLPRIDPKLLLEAIPRHRITLIALPATAWVGLAQVPGLERIDLSSLKTLMVFQYLPTEVFRRWLALVPNAQWINYWGQTEMSPLGASTLPGTLERKLVAPDPIGLPHLPLEIRVVDDRGEPLPPGGVGEMVARGPAVTPGYLDDPEANERLFAGGWHHTGDMGYFDDEGHLYFVDRKKDMIKTGGENVSSTEVEEAVSTCPGVGEVAVLGMPHPYWIEMVVAVVVPRPGETVTEEQILAHARGKLAAFKVPKQVVVAKELPRSPQGKLLKRVLKEALAKEELAGGTPEKSPR